MDKKLWMVFLIGILIAPMTAFASVNMKPQTSAEWRDYLRYRRDQTLDELYKLQPQARWEIMKAKGYATFTSLNVNLIFASVTGGRGIVHENGLFGKDTFMRMAQGGLGFGLGVKDFRAVFVFENKEVLDKFINSGWSFG